MRTVIDITDDTGEYGGSGLPSPASLHMEHDEVVVNLREVEWRMTFEQFLTLVEAMGAWLFRVNRGHHDDADIDEDPYPAAQEEHWSLRKIVTTMLGGQLGDVEVGEDVRRALRIALAGSQVTHARWVTLENHLLALQAENKELREKLR
jgi:hypothetical protein